VKDRILRECGEIWDYLKGEVQRVGQRKLGMMA
jgi:hypothetical protein